jgi:hypothetical protein
MDWFRLHHEFATDAKVQSMTEAMQRRLLMLMCMRCSNVLATLHDEEIAVALRISDAELAETKALFIRKRFINEDWELRQWDKRQYVSDSSTERSRKHREEKKKAVQQVCNVAATPPDTDTETDTEPNKKEKIPAPRVPSLGQTELETLGVQTQTAQEFLAIRKRKRAPLTELAMRGIRREADTAGWTLENALKKCVERGWQSFDASWVQEKPGHSARTGTRHGNFSAQDYHAGVGANGQF